MDQATQNMLSDLHFNGALLLSIVAKVAIAWILSLPLSVERARDDTSAGLRTIPVVAVASCGYVILAQMVLGVTNQQGAVLQGLLTGIGFIGGGAIVKEQNRVRGTATAAAILATGVMGAAIGYGRLELALITCLFTAVPLFFFSRYEMAHEAQYPLFNGADSSKSEASSPPPAPTTPSAR